MVTGYGLVFRQSSAPVACILIMSAENRIADIPAAMDLSGGAGGTSSIGGGDGVGGFRGGIGARLLCGSAVARRKGSGDF